MVFGLLIRTSIVAGSVYYTKRAGVWGSAEESEELLNNIKAELRPHARNLEKHLPFEMPDLPQRGKMSFLATHYYNEGVKSTFHFIEMVPCYTGQMIQKAKDTFSDFSQPPKPSN